MSITVHERPGVYSSYDASSLVSGRGSGRLVGLAAVNTVAAPGETLLSPAMTGRWPPLARKGRRAWRS